MPECDRLTDIHSTIWCDNIQLYMYWVNHQRHEEMISCNVNITTLFSKLANIQVFIVYIYIYQYCMLMLLLKSLMGQDIYSCCYLHSPCINTTDYIYIPACIYCTQFCLSPEPPSLTPIHNQTVCVGGEAVFQTDVTGVPPPLVTWFINGREVIPSYGYSIEVTDRRHSLVINQCKMDDAGHIVVRAENEVGQKQETGYLYVIGIKHSYLNCQSLFVYPTLN